MASQVAPQLDVLDTLSSPVGERGNVGQAATRLESGPADAGLVLLVGETRVELSGEIGAGLRHLIGGALRAISRGHTAILATTPDEEISTGTAAQMLGMSRTHVVNLIKKGVLPSHALRDGAGSHRRVRLSDIVAYRQRREAAATALAEMERVAMEYDLDALDESPARHT